MARPAAIITTGPASAPIDEVRRITNAASGETGALLANALVSLGWEVFLCRGGGATYTGAPDGSSLHEFETNEDLTRLLAKIAETRGPDIAAFFHAAALSDYKVASVNGPHGPIAHTGKIPGDLASMQIILEPAAKILPRLRGWFPRAWVAAWKYELAGTREEAIAVARGQLVPGHTDATVVNGAAYGLGFGVLEGENPPLHLATKRELADFLASRAAMAAKADK